MKQGQQVGGQGGYEHYFQKYVDKYSRGNYSTNLTEHERKAEIMKKYASSNLPQVKDITNETQIKQAYAQQYKSQYADKFKKDTTNETEIKQAYADQYKSQYADKFKKEFAHEAPAQNSDAKVLPATDLVKDNPADAEDVEKYSADRSNSLRQTVEPSTGSAEAVSLASQEAHGLRVMAFCVGNVAAFGVVAVLIRLRQRPASTPPQHFLHESL